MDVGRFTAEHRAAWDDLERLSASGRVLDHAGATQLVARYQQVSAHLSAARTHLDDPELIQYLTRLLASAQAAVYGQRQRPRAAVRRFLTESFPAAVWFHRRQIALSALLLLAPAFIVGAWLAVSDEAVEASAPAAVRASYLENDFEAYYSSEPAAQFASEVFFNNIQVAILAFAVGILLCLPTAYVLVSNGAAIGVAGGLFTAAGRWQVFWGLITPHGLLELAAIVVAGATGMSLGWAIIAPGDRPRTVALAEAGRRAMVVVFGLIIAFGVAAIIEGFVTGTSLPTVVRVSIGVGAFAAFVAWILAYGPAATQSGATGLLGDPAHQRPDALSSR